MKLFKSLDDALLTLLRLGTFLCFLAWAWVHYYWEGPYAVLIWNETTFDWAESLGYDWNDVVGTGYNDGLFQFALSQIYWGYVLCAIISLTVKKESKFQIGSLYLGSCMLVVLMYAKFLVSKEQLPMFVENGGQILMPLILVSAVSLGLRSKVTLWVTCVGFVSTFAGHGCYAVGLWPTPSTFYAMTSVILGFEIETTKLFLRIAGLMDFLVCIGIFITSIRRYCAIYAAVWGLLTAMARPVAGMSFTLNYFGADQFLHEALLRAPHYFIPFFMFLVWKK